MCIFCCAASGRTKDLMCCLLEEWPLNIICAHHSATFQSCLQKCMKTTYYLSLDRRICPWSIALRSLWWCYYLVSHRTKAPTKKSWVWWFLKYFIPSISSCCIIRIVFVDERDWHDALLCFLWHRRSWWHQIEGLRWLRSRSILQRQMSGRSSAATQTSMREESGWATWRIVIQAAWKQSSWGLSNLLFAAAAWSKKNRFAFMLLQTNLWRL